MKRERSDIVGVVLAGGLSRRMGGGDKGLLDVAGKPMLTRVVERLTPQVSCIVINANGPPERFAGYGLPVVADPIDGFAGPLAGVLAGMRWTREAMPSATAIATVSSDAPFVPLDLVARLAQAVGDRTNAISIAKSEGHLHPVIGLWPVALADDLEAALADGVRKVLNWTDRHGTVPVAFEAVTIGTAAIDPFFNANTPDELATATRLLSEGRS
ncbi:MAG: molybdenum cofactor guanylyltransferase MobA [Hyphomicrobiaceae bacterium]